jgi:aspartate racemase
MHQPQAPVGIIGGLSWASTIQYYRLVNLEINRALGRQASAEILLRSVDFQPIVDAQVRDDWQAAGKILTAAARDLESGGARAFLIASNTMHLVYDHIAREVGIPGINIFDATCEALREKQIDRALILGTRYTMGMQFYRDEYRRRGIDVAVPDETDARRVNEIIFRELIHGRVNAGSAAYLRGLVAGAAANGTKAVILGCTELDLLLDDRDKIPGCAIIDTTSCHARAAAKWMLSPEPT